ncbi:hypothetical protein E4U55_007533 [Claviceps digitariae]|nr:hypothetical protein E4U55_007533 [Claviceps digitariae]
MHPTRSTINSIQSINLSRHPHESRQNFTPSSPNPPATTNLNPHPSFHAMYPSEPPMAPQPTAALPGADRIRSLQDDDDIFNAFDAYPWKKDKMFLSGLSAILGPPSSSNASPADMAIHARIFYYAQRIGVQVDFAKYTAWLAQNPHHAPPQVLPEEYLAAAAAPSSPSSPSSKNITTTTSEPLLPWQQAAPRADLYVDRNVAAEAADGQPSYPMGFADMLKLLQEGKEIPGIRQIPNTVARDASIKPVGTRTAPRKPWEKDSTHQIPELSFPRTLDAEFPSVDTDADPIGPESPLETATS